MAPVEGNGKGWSPPSSISDIVWHFDSSTGCGDLMFSSHTIFAVATTCIIYHYFGYRKLHKLIATVSLCFLLPLTLMSRKHYTIDVFTALYVVPGIFFILRTRFPDRSDAAGLSNVYGITFETDPQTNMSFVLTPSGRYEVLFSSIPHELRRRKMTLEVDCAAGKGRVGFDESDGGSDFGYDDFGDVEMAHLVVKE